MDLQHTTRLARTEKPGVETSFEAVPEHCGFVSTNVDCWITNTLFVGPTDRYKRPQNPKISALKLTLQQRI